MTLETFNERYLGFFDDQKKEYIKQEVELLYENANDLSIGAEYNTKYNEFIGPNNELITEGNQLFYNTKLDDPKLYFDCINYIADNSVDMSNKLVIINNIQKFIWDRFGSTPADKIDRLEFNTKYDNDFSIKELYGNNMASSVERSAVAHNVFKVLGIDSTLEFANANEDNYHAFITLKLNNNTRLLYDPTLSVKYYKDGEEKIGLGLSSINNKDYESGNFKFNYGLVKTIYQGADLFKEEPIVYTKEKTETKIL